jgi:conjugal transfer ATP-binding protein TraC
MNIIDLFKRKDSTKTDTPLQKEIKIAETNTIKDTLAPSAFQINPKDFFIGDVKGRTYFIMSYPRFLNDNWLSPLINLDKVFDISIHITPIETVEMMKKFQRKVAEVQSQMMTREEKGMVRDPMLETAFEDLEGLRDDLMQAQEKMYEVGLYITIYAKNDLDLDKVEREIKSLLESNMIQVRPALYQQDQAFISNLPLCKDELMVTTKINTSPLSSTFPFVSFDLTSDKGILYGINRHNGSLVLFDRFSLENYNSIVFAKSGSGKSYCTKLEILRTLMFDTKVIIIDPEREYEALTDAVGGRYFNISLTGDHHINPFDLPLPGPDESMSDVLRSNIVTLVGLFRVMFGGLTPEEDSIIDRAITETYALKDITPESDFSSIDPPLLTDFEMVLSGFDNTENLIEKLQKFTKGSWSGFLNQPTNVNIDQVCVSFSIRDMEDDLKPVAMFLISHYIWNAVRKDIRKRLLVVDEAWIMMKSPDTASFLYGLAKRGRKYYLGLATITQDVNDFLKSEYGVPIITNSSIQILLKQSPTTIDLIQKTFNLTDEEKYLLLQSNVGEGIFFAGLKHAAIKIIASHTEDQIITSDPREIEKIQNLKKNLI